MLISNNEEEESVQQVRKMLPLFCLNTPKDSNGRKIVIQKYRECTLLLENLYKELRCLCLTIPTTDGKDYRAIANITMKRKTEISVLEWFQVVLFSSSRSDMHVVRSNYGIPTTNIGLL